jgi:hypothetical protein
MRLILLGFFLVPGLVLAKPKAPEAPAISWTMADEALSVVLKAGTVEQISALPGVNGQAARFIIRLRAGKADYRATDQSTEFKGLETAQVNRVLRLLGLQTTSEGLYSQNTPDGHNTPRVVQALKAGKASRPVASWDMADDDLRVLLKTGTVEQISALPGVNAEGARFIVRFRAGKAPLSGINDVISREHVDKVVRLLEITSRPTFE